uniref:Proteasome 20S subunit alpha 5 n=1 Tax=Anas platyrhynchos platyrhynchos TaxID=8840 RepID=A0A493T5X0_ANAPP
MCPLELIQTWGGWEACLGAVTPGFPLLAGCAMSGLIADAKTLIDKARVETQNHWFTYNETMTVESVTQAVSNLALQFGEEDADPGAMSRPFGVALLFGGVDEKGPQLFHMDPSGTFVQCDARAIGSASEGAQSSLQEVYHKVKGRAGLTSHKLEVARDSQGSTRFLTDE